MITKTSKPVRLLVVDDIEDNRALLGRRFARRGFEVVEADCGSVALDLIAQHSFDLVLLDIMMPGLDGYEVLERIRRDYSPDDLPVVMVTARAGNTDIVQALELGANDYITKPIDFAIAFARVQTQLTRREAQQALARSIAELVSTNTRLAGEIAERKRSEARVHHMAYHDALTGLGNRIAFHQQLDRDLKHLDRRGDLAVLVIDLDGFKLINDTLGQRVGDALLTIVGERLRGGVPGNGTVARVGSDEFAMIRTGVTRPDDVSAWAATIAQAIAAPCRIEGHELVLDCSIGIALAPLDGRDPDLLLSHAHLAMLRAKSDGRGSCRFFETGMDARAQARRMVESDLRKALSANQFELHYQPQFNLASNAISGFEALLRWHHPERGMISPADFIPLAEEIGLIVPIGAWVLRHACREAARWPDDIKLAVNISAVQFRDPLLVQTITAALAAADLSADRLELEITETVVLDSNAGNLDVLHHLRGLGVRISIDDFGTGYSSLSYLRKFPFDKIKIDQSFIKDLDRTTASEGRGDTRAIVRAITALAAGMGMITTAEGVETRAQLEWLRVEGCTEVQGFLMSRPVPAGDIDLLLKVSHFVRKVA